MALIGKGRISSLPRPAATGRTPARAFRRAAVAPVRAGLSDLINTFTVAIQNSPLAAGKAALAKLQAGEYDEAKTQATLDRYIADNPVMMFSFSSCPFCVKAKKVLDDAGARWVSRRRRLSAAASPAATSPADQ
jgi:hypothetical protein